MKPVKKFFFWWEIRRVPYNIILAVVGYLSFYIGAVTIPLIYVLIGVMLNILYSVLWVIDIAIQRKLRQKVSSMVWIVYTTLSIAFVIGFAYWISIA